MSFHPVLTTDGLTQASSVIAVVRRNDGASGIVTSALEPLKTSALPNFPLVVHVAFAIAPLLPCPDTSVTAVPAPSSNAYAATSCGLVASVVALGTLEYGLRLAAASVARIR